MLEGDDSRFEHTVFENSHTPRRHGDKIIGISGKPGRKGAGHQERTPRHQGTTEHRHGTLRSTAACPTTGKALRGSMRAQGAVAGDMRRAAPSGMRLDDPKPAVKHGNMHHLGGDAPKDNFYHAGNRTALHFHENDRNGNQP